MFDGFDVPQQNYFKMPAQWIDLSSQMTLAELKVVEYVLRHTWGFAEYDGKLKRISLDEFMHGRKRHDGTRIDCGTCLDKKSVITGLRRAVENGFLTVKEEGDPGRRKKSYGLRMRSNFSLLGLVDNFHEGSGKSPHRTEKETKRKKQVNSTSSRARILSTTFDTTSGAHLRSILTRYNSDLISPPRRVRVGTLTKSITRLRLERGVSEDEITDVLEWYDLHYAEQYTPKMRKAADFCDKWSQICDARQRSLDSNGSRVVGKGERCSKEHARKMRARKRVVDWLVDEGYLADPDDPLVNQLMVDRALSALDERTWISDTFVLTKGREDEN